MNHKKIAELTHTSPSTVSKALAGSSEISRELAENIRRVAIECGYFLEKNKRKREYTKNSSIFIALVVPEVLGYRFASIITFLKNEIEKRGGYAAVYIDDFDREKRRKLIETVILHGRADGIIAFSEFDFRCEINIPVVCLVGVHLKSFDSVGCDMSKIINDSVCYLKGLGHSKIGFAGEFNTLWASDSFVKAMKDNKIPLCEEFVYIVDGRFEEIGIETAKRILSSSRRPTAVICAYDEVAIALIHTLKEKGVRVPYDISVMGINNISFSAYSGVPLTTVETFSPEQYKTAVDILFDKIITGTDAIKHITIEHKIIERETTVPPSEEI